MIRQRLGCQRVIAALVAAVALFLFGCKPKVEVKRPVVKKAPPAEQLYAEAESLFGQGRLDEAAALYSEYLRVEPRGKWAADCLKRIGQIHLSAGRLEQAFQSFARIRRDFPGYGQMAEVEAALISSLWKMGALEEVIVEAEQWLSKYPENPLKAQVAQLLAKAYYEKLQYAKALRWFLFAQAGFQVAEPEKAKEVGEQISAIINEADRVALEQMVDVTRHTKYYPEVAYRLASIYYRTDRLEDAEAIVTELLGLRVEDKWLELARGLYEKIFLALSVDPHKIGCLLPLTGPFGIYGAEVLNGIQMAIGVFAGDDSGVEVVIEDTAGDPSKASQGIEHLVKREHVIAAVGPLLSRCAEQAADKAEALGLPLITICRKEDITDKGPMIFRNFLLPKKEVKRLVDVAMGRLDIRRFAIMFPDNAYGRYYMQLFWDMVEARGGEIRAAEPYDPSLTDFAVQIKRMVGTQGPRPKAVIQEIRAARLPEEEESQLDPKDNDPIVDFEAVFIPDAAERVAMIAPQLVYHDVTNVWLLGTSLWASGPLISIAGDYLQGALFTSGFVATSQDEQVMSFVEQYQSYYDTTPGLLAATGYDTINFLKQIIRHSAPSTRNKMRDAIVHSLPYGGVTGEISFDSRGEVSTEPFLVTVLGKREVLFP